MTDSGRYGKMLGCLGTDDRMARPREFDEEAVLDAAVNCFWAQGYEATSVRDLVEKTGITGASLYNAFGDKRALYRKALDHYIEGSIADRMRRCEKLAPREAISAFLAEIVKRSLEDCQPRFAAAMMVLGSMVQTNGFGLTL